MVVYLAQDMPGDLVGGGRFGIRTDGLSPDDVQTVFPRPYRQFLLQIIGPIFPAGVWMQPPLQGTKIKRQHRCGQTIADHIGGYFFLFHFHPHHKEKAPRCDFRNRVLLFLLFGLSGPARPHFPGCATHPARRRRLPGRPAAWPCWPSGRGRSGRWWWKAPGPHRQR